MNHGSGAQNNPPSTVEGFTEPKSVEAIFRDFMGRRAAIIKALTTEVEEFYQQCDPKKLNLCLYGFPDKKWQLKLPEVEIPSDLPEPPLGINFARDGMQEKDWLALVAFHSDSWLLSLAFYFAGRVRFNRAARNRLFTLINDLPTIAEVVTGTVKKAADEVSSVLNLNNIKLKSGSKGGFESGESSKQAKDEDMRLYGEDNEDTLSGASGYEF